MRRAFFRPFRAFSFLFSSTHGLRRGLHSSAAPRLGVMLSSAETNVKTQPSAARPERVRDPFPHSLSTTTKAGNFAYGRVLWQTP